MTSPVSGAAEPAANGVAGWGDNSYGQVSAPSELTGVTALSAGGYHSLALRGDGTVVGWGFNFDGQASVPAGLTDVSAVSAGKFHSLALQSDGTIVGWGDGTNQQTRPPAGLTDAIAISAGASFSLAVRREGSVHGWGLDNFGQCDAPADLTDAIAVSAGEYHGLALRGDGTIVAWGDDYYGQSTVPATLTDVIAIDAGDNHNLALRDDGTVVAWGANGSGQSTVPAELNDVTAIAAGGDQSLALRADGTIVTWGANGGSPVAAGLSDVTAISAGGAHGLAAGPRPVFTADAPPTTATVGAPYSSVFTADGATTFELASGTLPAGLALTSEGVLSGTPTAEGTSAFTVAARNAFGTTASSTHTIAVAAAAIAPTISGTVAAGVVGSAYDYVYTVTGTPIPEVTLSSGTLPPGLTLEKTGRLSGTPTTAGTYSFTVAAISSAGTATADSTVTIAPKAVTTKADLSVDIAAPTSAAKGKTYVYSVTTKNVGPASSSNVSTKVILPLNTQFVSATGKYTRIGNLVIFQRSTLAKGQRVVDKITVKATGTGKGTALATAFSVKTPDPAILDNADNTTTTVR